MAERYTSESDFKDDIYGEYPFLLYKHYFITRGNIPRFLKMMTGINGNGRMSLEDRERAEVLEMMVIHRLHLVTKINFHMTHLQPLHSSLVASLLFPLHSIRTRLELSSMLRYAGELADVGGEL